jgi:DNA modification methylase
MWPRERRAQGIDHPTPKPLELIVNSLHYWSRPEDIIFDPWCGSGTHLVAALRTGHRCIGIDIDERWVRGSIERLEAEDRLSSVMARRDGQGALFDVGK